MRTCFFFRVEGHALPCIADLVYFKEPFNSYVITRINVPKEVRGRGHGRQLMAKILKEADAEHLPLMLAPEPSGGLKFRELVAWYERCGFVWTRSEAMMERAAR